VPFVPPNVTDVVESSDSGSSVSFPVGSSVEEDVFVAEVLWAFGSGDTTPATTGSTGWTRRRQVGATSAGELAVHEIWTATSISGAPTSLDISTDSAGDAVAVIRTLDAHFAHGAYTFDPVGVPNYSTDVRYQSGEEIATDPVPQGYIVFSNLAGNDYAAGYALASAAPPGWTYDGSIIGGQAHLATAYLQNTGTIENPFGTWVFDTAGGGWTWDDWGTPENSAGTPPTPDGDGFVFIDSPYYIWWNDYFVEVEEDVPYWGMLCTPSDS
jgi:hypothetical protein